MSRDLNTELFWLDALNWDADGLIPVIAQDATSGAVLMLAWMNRAALEATVREGVAVYWSRSRQKLWKKGEESGHIQTVRHLAADCDGDALLLTVEQAGDIACHTGRKSCFFYEISDQHWHAAQPVLKDPKAIYR